LKLTSGEFLFLPQVDLASKKIFCMSSSVLAAELLAILCCPETQQDLVLVDVATVQKFNREIVEKKIRTRSGKVVDSPVDGLLIRQDRKIVFLVRNRIPVMLVDEAVEWNREI
jgi:uncharacterized protein